MDSKSDTLKNAYQLRFERTAVYRNNLWRILCRRYFNQFITPRMAVLDLGCGWGEFINNIQTGRKFAMDMNPDAGKHLFEETTFINQDCSRQWPLAAESLDMVFTSNFLEHLPDKSCIERTISEAFRCLKRGGLIICLGPNIRHVPAAYWDFWDHLVPLTDLSIAELLKLNGFAIQRRIARFLPYSMSSDRRPPLFLAAWYLKMRMVWPFFGKQFLVIGRKY